MNSSTVERKHKTKNIDSLILESQKENTQLQTSIYQFFNGKKKTQLETFIHQSVKVKRKTYN
jgi:hypothetical protein